VADDSIVSLADLASAGLRFEWYEALAIVQELCGAVYESPDQVGASTLGPATICIGPSGDVMAMAGPQSQQAAVRRVGEIFRELLPQFHVTSTFNVVLQKTAARPPGYASVRELSRALEPFERPNRTDIVRAVYQRWRAMGAKPTPGSLDIFKPGASLEPNQRPLAPNPSRALGAPSGTSPLERLVQYRAALAIAGLLVLAIGLGLGIFAYTHRTVSPRAAAASAIESIGRVRDTALNAVGSVVGLTTENKAGPDVEPATVASARKKPGRPRPVRAEPPPVEPGPLDRPEPTATVFTATATSNSSSPDSAATIAPVPASVPQIFTQANPDVMPPVAVFPQRLWRLPGSGRSQDLAMVEIVVGENGLVESVKPRELPHGLGNSLMVTLSLSAVKSWRFSPALKDGHPVRYRQLVSVALQ